MTAPIVTDKGQRHAYPPDEEWRDYLQWWAEQNPGTQSLGSFSYLPPEKQAEWRQLRDTFLELRTTTLERLGVRTLAQVEEEEITWLWQHRVACGEIAVLEGDPETGKTTLTSHIVACVTRGAPISDDDVAREPGAVLLCATEDSVSKVLRPQLRVHGADLSRVHEMCMKADDEGNPVPLAFPRDAQRMQEIIEELDVRLVVVSPITACFGEETNTNNEPSVRRALTPLARVSQETDAAIVLIRHLNKDQSMKALYRGGGSIAFMGISRSGMVVGEHEGMRVVAMVKNNLHDKRLISALGFRLVAPTGEAVPVVRWEGPLPVTAEDLVRSGRDAAPRRQEAKKVIRALLDGAGWIAADAVHRARKDGGFAKETWDRAASELGVEKKGERDSSGQVVEWRWRL